MTSDLETERGDANSENWIDAPHNRWGFLHVSELARTVPIGGSRDPVEPLPRRPHDISEFSFDHLERRWTLGEMFEALGELEGLCAKWSALRMSEIERQKLGILTAECAKSVEANDFARFAVVNEKFHQVIYAGTHNASLQQITQSFRQRLAPFRVPALFLIEGRINSSLVEHREILDAIAKGDGDRASHAMRTHVASASVSVIDHFEKVRAGIVPKPGSSRRSIEHVREMGYDMKGDER